MAILEVNNVSIRYITGDFKDIGLKEFVMRKLTGNYHVTEFWADKDVTFSLERGRCWASSAPTAPVNPRC